MLVRREKLCDASCGYTTEIAEGFELTIWRECFGDYELLIIWVGSSSLLAGRYGLEEHDAP